MVAAITATSACAHVGQEDFDAGMAELRAEIIRGDEDVSRRLGGRIDSVEGRLAQLEQELAALESEFDVTVEKMETALRLHVPVYFDFDAAALGPEARVALGRFGGVVREYYPESLVTVEGFTDPSGSAEYNRRLGQRRADAVRDHLVGEAGLFDGLVRAVSYGEDTRRLVIPGETGPGQAGWQNRRVVLVIDHGGDGPRPTVTQDPASS